jgi:hypothetical protein
MMGLNNLTIFARAKTALAIFRERRFQRELGAAFVEFALFLPFLILLMYGVVELGRLLSNISWISQAAYHGTMIGTETSSSFGEEVVRARINDFYDIQGEKLSNAPISHTAYEEASNSRLVTVEIHASIPELLNVPTPWSKLDSLTMNVRLAGPLLVKNSGIPSNLNEFGTNGCIYDCAGQPVCCGNGCSASMGPNNCEFAPPPFVPPPPSGHGGSCFLAGTLISMADGSLKPIEAIRGWDRVISYDHTTGQFEIGFVVSTFTRREQEHLIINDYLRVTPVHPFYLPETDRWVSARELKVGDQLLAGSGAYVRVDSISDATIDSVEVFNFHVEPNNTYVAGGIVVHNAVNKTEWVFMQESEGL